jgi:hypothetical protein
MFHFKPYLSAIFLLEVNNYYGMIPVSTQLFFFFQRLIALLVLHFYFYFSFHLIILNDIYRITVVMSVETFKTGIIVFIGNIMFLTSH